MAFQVSDIKISGTMNGLSFYNSEFGWLVRTKGGPTGKQFKRSPAFVRARENSSEFTLCSRAASSIRKLIIKRTNTKDKALYHRLIKLMRILTNFDQTSPRGHRCPLKGMRNPNSFSIVRSFELQPGLNLYNILVSAHVLKPIKKLRRKKPINFLHRTQGLSTNPTRIPIVFKASMISTTHALTFCSTTRKCVTWSDS